MRLFVRTDALACDLQAQSIHVSEEATRRTLLTNRESRLGTLPADWAKRYSRSFVEIKKIIE